MAGFEVTLHGRFWASAEDTIFKRFDEECSKYELPLAKLHLEELRLKHSLRKLHLEALVAQFAVYADSLRANWEHKETNKEKLGEHDLESFAARPVPQSELFLVLMYLLFLGLIRITNEGDYRLTPIAHWRLQAERLGLLHDTFAHWLSYVEKCLNASEAELIALLQDVNSTTEERRVPALLLSSKESLAPEDRLYANLTLVLILNFYNFWRDDVDNIVLSLISNAWRRIVEQQRFALRSPNITAPAILRACDETASQGLRKAAKIILAAIDGVQISTPAHVLDRLKALAG